MDKNPNNNENIFIAGLRIKSSRIRNFKSNSLRLEVGDKCIVDTEEGEEFATVVIAPRNAAPEKHKKIREILRKATMEDLEKIKKNTAMEKEALETANRKVEEKKLPMKMIKVDFSFDTEKAVFYYASEGRVDFRDLIRDLANHFKIKIEMHQIGMREKAKMLGGCGSCGQILCCDSFLKDFEPVSIRMAKDQNLALNPTKISGLCGRLMCCLIYENDFYVQQKKIMPRCGCIVKTAEGKGKVIQCDYLTEKVVVEIEGEEKKRVKAKVEEITIESDKKKK